MRLLIASDIHGDGKCCEAMLSSAEKENVDKILILGDILYHGPRNPLPENYTPKQVISLLNSNKDSLICVRGNCDTEVDAMVLEFPILSVYSQVYDGDCNLNLFMSHGHIYNPDTLPPLTGNTVFLYGHTHVFKKEIRGKTVCVNPGSVSLPKENNPKTFMIYDSGEFKVKDFDSNVLMKFNVSDR